MNASAAHVRVEQSPRVSVILLCAIVVAYPLEFSKLLFAADANTAADLLKVFAFFLLAFRAPMLRAAVGDLPMSWQAAWASLMGLIVISLLYTYSASATLIEAGRFVTWLCLMAMIYQLVRVYGDVALAAWISAMRWTVLAQAMLIVAEAALAWHLWQYSVDIDFEELTRYHGTFSDANIAARFLAVGLMLWLLPVRDSRDTSFALRLAPTLTILAAIVLTGSRSGLLALAPALLLIAFRSSWRVGLLVIFIMAAAIGGVVYVLQSGVEANAITRLTSLSDPAEAFGERLPLLLAALTMFRDHPIGGIGWGAFESVYVSEYAYLIGEKDLTKSHTAVLTMAAELGTLGLVAMAFIIALIAREAFRPSYRFGRALSIALVAGIMIIFLSAQSEGRFWEDAMLWMLMGILLANSRSSASEPGARPSKTRARASR